MKADPSPSMYGADHLRELRGEVGLGDDPDLLDLRVLLGGERLAELADGVLGLGDRRRLRRLHPLDLLVDVPLILGELVGQTAQLVADLIADEPQAPHHHEDREHHGGDPGELRPLEQPGDRHQGEAEQDRQGERLEDLRRQVHERDDGEDGEGDDDRMVHHRVLALGGHWSVLPRGMV